MDGKKIGLALSGGGVRAMVYHCGVLRWLAENKQLENVSHISSVSGGSLLVGLIFKENNWKWPSSNTFIKSIAPQVKNILTTKDLQAIAIRNLFFPSNWKYILSRANVLSKTIEQYWGVIARLNELPDNPTWSLNGTTAENGRRFRFKRNQCGDYELGYTDAANIKVADAMAVSAAFPVGIGPLVVNSTQHTWKKRRKWDDPIEQAIEVTLPYKRIHLYDGGVYDNLGIEPLFDVGKQTFKDDIGFLIVSDAGKPLERTSPGFALNPFRAKRIADIALDQTRALRIRAFINFLQSNKKAGLYFQLGAIAEQVINEYSSSNQSVAIELLKMTWLAEKDVKDSAAYPTDLWRVNDKTFDTIEKHGYETAKWNYELFA